MSSRLRAHLDLLGLNLVTLAAASLLAGATYAQYRHHLGQHAEWTSTKTLLAKRVMGGRTFTNTPNALHRNRLDLGAWFGFQEVLTTRPLDLAGMDVRFCFEPEGYVNVLYDVRANGFAGIRFSDRRDLPTVQFRASPEGEFLATSPVATGGPVAAEKAHDVRIRFERASAVISLDGRTIGSYPRTAGPQRVGFRGGQRAAWVDDVELRLVDGSKVRETFSNWGRSVRPGLAFFCLTGALLGLGALAARHAFGVPVRRVGLGTALVASGLAILAAGACVLVFLVPRRYPGGLGQTERKEIETARRRLLDEFRDRGASRSGDAYRILVLGSSQTWGAGATRLDDVWVRQLERKLSAGAGRQVECLNAGVSGLTSSGVRESLDELLRTEPDAVIINLSNNDVVPAELRANLDTVVAQLARRGIRAVLLLEPNSPERRPTDSLHGDLGVKHAAVRAVGNAYGVPVIDVHGYLAGKQDSGFLWWDFVHLTSFGQRLVAEKLAADLPALLPLREPR